MVKKTKLCVKIWVPREKLWYALRMLGVAEKYVRRLDQDMYEKSVTEVNFALGQTEEFELKVYLHQGLANSLSLFK